MPTTGGAAFDSCSKNYSSKWRCGEVLQNYTYRITTFIL